MASSKQEILIRAGGVELVDRLRPLWLSLYEHHRAVAEILGELWPFRTADESWDVRRGEYEQWLRDEGNAFILLAEREGVTLGYAVVRVGLGGATLQTGDVGKLESLNVLPVARGSGVGQMLMAEIHRLLAERGVCAIATSVMTGNTGAARFYERLGMVEFGTTLIGPVKADSAERLHGT